jgi:hypothetical protein
MPVDITWTTLRNDAAVRKLIWPAICQWSVDDNGELELNHGKDRGQIEAGSATKTPEAGPVRPTLPVPTPRVSGGEDATI